MKPPFPYYGAKIRMAPRIAALLPPHTTYLEPYAGSLAVLLAKEPSEVETVNDLDGDLVLFWRVLRDQPEELERLCALTPHSREEHDRSEERGAELGELERARRVWVTLTQTRGGATHKRGWRRQLAAPRRIPGEGPAFAARLAPAAERLRDVILECSDGLGLIRDYGKHEGTCIYADPPYLGATRYGNKYTHEMPDESQHRELAAALNDCRASVVLSGYHSPLYDELYDGWDRHEIETSTTQGGARSARTEVLWVKQAGDGTAREPDRQLTDAMF